ncbi:MAG: RDD family protein [Bdellovibrionales bacterium]|nr:RDD family protein [Bdellovibrionales bacterium]
MITNPADKSEEFADLSALTEQSLDFSALDRGLGFRGPDRGTGATAAGQARFVNPSPLKAPSPVQLPAASPWIRSAAFLIDMALLLTPWIFIFSVVLEGVPPALLAESVSMDRLLGFAALYGFSYFLIAESLGGQSLGKMLLGLRIVEDDKYEKPAGFSLALARMAVFPLSLGALGLGLLWAFTDHKRRPWHDRATRTIVRKKAF